MKLTTLFLVLIIVIPGTAFADCYFQSQGLSGLHLINTDKTENAAEIMDADGNRQWVQLGDTIANARARIVKIDGASVTVKTPKGHTKISIVKGASTGNNSVDFH